MVYETTDARDGAVTRNSKAMPDKRLAARRAAGLDTTGDISKLPQVKKARDDEAKRLKQLAEVQAAKKALKK